MAEQISIDYLIKNTWHLIDKMYNVQASEFGLTRSMGFVLLNLPKEGSISSTQIAPKLGMEASSLTRVLKKLEEMELISRQRSKDDARNVHIALTQKGKNKREIAKKTVRSFNTEINSQLTQSELETLRLAIEKINKITNQKLEKTYNNS